MGSELPRDMFGQGANRRRFNRFFPRMCDAALAPRTNGFLQFLASPKRDLAAAIVNLSEGGLHIVTKGEWAVGKRVRTFLSVKVFNDVIEVDGLISWSREHAQRYGSFHTGVRFEGAKGVHAYKITSLRDYLNSPEFKKKELTRNRLRPEYDSSAIQFDI